MSRLLSDSQLVQKGGNYSRLWAFFKKRSFVAQISHYLHITLAAQQQAMRRDAYMRTINRSQPRPQNHLKQRSPKEKLVVTKKEQPLERSPTAINLFGITITGMDPRLINQARLRLSVPVEAGKARVFGVDRNAKIKVHSECVANVDIRLVRNDDGALALEHFSLNLSKSIKVKNPSASLEPHAGKSYLGMKLKDQLANVSIKSITIDHNGQVLVDGQIKILHALKKRIPRSLSIEKVPVLDEAALVKLGIIAGSDNSETNKLSSLSKKFNIKQILKKIGALTGVATFDLSINGDEAQASFLKNNTMVQGHVAPLYIKLAGTTDLSSAGDLLIVVDGKRSTIESSLGVYVPHMEAKISRVGEERPMKVRLNGKISGMSKQISVNTFSDKEIKTVMPRRRAGPIIPLTPTSEDDFNLSCGAQAVKIKASVELKAQVKAGLKQMRGSGKLNVVATEPFVKTHERGINFGGAISAKMDVNRFSYKAGLGLTTASAHTDIGFFPNAMTMRQYPELRPVEFNYEAQITGPGQAEITPPPFGASRIVRPVKNFEGHDERADTPLTRTNFRPIGSPEYFRHVEKITGAKPRHADRVELLIDGICSMPKRLELIKEAKDIICFQTLVFKHDAAGLEYAQALVDAAKRGVRVVGVIDAIGNIESFKDLSTPNPIYEYFRSNGVELCLYNGFLEDGLRKIIDIAQAYPEVFTSFTNKSLMGVAEALRFFEQVADVADDDANALPLTIRRELQNAVHTLMNGQEGVSPHNSVSELKQILSGNMTSFEEFLLAIKRIGDVSYRWHEKYLIVDGEHAVVGGMNIANEYLHGGSGEMVRIKNKSQPAWRDSDVYLSGEVVTDVFRSFRQNWFHVAGERISMPKQSVEKTDLENKQGHTVSIIQHRPLPDGDHNVTNFLLYNLRTLKAGEKAWFETAYFLPRGVLRSLQKEMVAAAKRGVDVRILTNSEQTSDFGPLVEAAVFDTRELLRAGARVFHRNNDRMVHAKVSVLGDMLTMVGSWNMDNRSASHDSEDVCAIYDRAITEQMSEQLKIDMFEQSDEITLANIGKRSLAKEFRSAGMLLMGELA